MNLLNRTPQIQKQSFTYKILEVGVLRGIKILHDKLLEIGKSNTSLKFLNFCKREENSVL